MARLFTADEAPADNKPGMMTLRRRIRRGTQPGRAAAEQVPPAPGEITAELASEPEPTPEASEAETFQDMYEGEQSEPSHVQAASAPQTEVLFARRTLADAEADIAGWMNHTTHLRQQVAQLTQANQNGRQYTEQLSRQVAQLQQVNAKAAAYIEQLQKQVTQLVETNSRLSASLYVLTERGGSMPSGTDPGPEGTKRRRRTWRRLWLR